MRTMGMEYFKQKQMPDSIECLASSLAINPMYPKAWLWLGCAYMQQDNLDKAAQAFLRVVHQVPDDGETWNNLGAVYLRLDKKEEAFKAFEQAIKHLQEKPKIWQNLLYCLLGRTVPQIKRCGEHESQKGELSSDLSALK